MSDTLKILFLPTFLEISDPYINELLFKTLDNITLKFYTKYIFNGPVMTVL